MHFYVNWPSCMVTAVPKTDSVFEGGSFFLQNMRQTTLFFMYLIRNAGSFYVELYIIELLSQQQCIYAVKNKCKHCKNESAVLITSHIHST